MAKRVSGCGGGGGVRCWCALGAGESQMSDAVDSGSVLPSRWTWSGTLADPGPFRQSEFVPW